MYTVKSAPRSEQWDEEWHGLNGNFILEENSIVLRRWRRKYYNVRRKNEGKVLLRLVWECGQCCGSSLLCRHNERDGLATRLGSCRKWLTGGSPGPFVAVDVFVAVVGEAVAVD